MVDRDVDFEITKLWRDRDVNRRPTTLARALTDNERDMVERRRNELTIGCASFTAAESDRAVKAISGMLGGIRSLRNDSVEAAVAGIEGLRRTLSDLPLWAIEAGCLAISRGEAVVDGRTMDRRWAPNDSEVYGVVNALVAPYRQALDNVTALLAAPVRDARRA